MLIVLEHPTSDFYRDYIHTNERNESAMPLFGQIVVRNITPLFSIQTTFLRTTRIPREFDYPHVGDDDGRRRERNVITHARISQCCPVRSAESSDGYFDSTPPCILRVEMHLDFCRPRRWPPSFLLARASFMLPLPSMYHEKVASDAPLKRVRV